jgi:hypothetical protein
MPAFLSTTVLPYMPWQLLHLAPFLQRTVAVRVAFQLLKLHRISAMRGATVMKLSRTIVPVDCALDASAVHQKYVQVEFKYMKCKGLPCRQ